VAVPTDPRTRIAQASRRVKKAEAELATARKDLRGAVSAAWLVGEMSFSEIGRELGISRQRVAELVRAAEEEA
jgi:DNA-binding transcriptional regulator LsrR (DeoR family)